MSSLTSARCAAEEHHVVAGLSHGVAQEARKCRPQAGQTLAAGCQCCAAIVESSKRAWMRMSVRGWTAAACRLPLLAPQTRRQYEGLHGDEFKRLNGRWLMAAKVAPQVEGRIAMPQTL